MDLQVLRRELKSIETLALDGIISKEKAERLKDNVISRFVGDYSPSEEPVVVQNDLAHLPGRLVGGIIDFCKSINGARCAGVDPSQQGTNARARSPKEMMDDMPDMYK